MWIMDVAQVCFNGKKWKQETGFRLIICVTQGQDLNSQLTLHAILYLHRSKCRQTYVPKYTAWSSPSFWGISVVNPSYYLYLIRSLHGRKKFQELHFYKIIILGCGLSVRGDCLTFGRQRCGQSKIYDSLLLSSRKLLFTEKTTSEKLSGSMLLGSFY